MENEYLSSEEEILGELSKVSDLKGGGPILYVDEDNEAYCQNKATNAIFLGVTGCGKTRRGTIPLVISLIQNSESFIAVDPKGDLFEYTQHFAQLQDYDITILNFRDVLKSNTIDIFQYAYELYNSGDINKKQLAIEIIDDFANSVYLTGNGFVKDPFWDNSAKSLFSGVVIFLLEHAKRSEVNIASIVNLISILKQRSFPPRTNIEEICSLHPEKTYSFLMNNLKGAPSETAGSILSSTFEPLSKFVKSEGIRSLISTPGLDIMKLDGKKPVAIYIILPDENDNYSSLAAILLGQLVSHYIRIAHTDFGGRLPRRMNIIIEELSSMGSSFPKLHHQMVAGRSRFLRTFFCIQSLSQLDDLYGSSKATSIIANADTIIAYRTNHMETLETLSKRCGDIDDEYHQIPKRRVSPDELGSLKTGEALIIMSGRIKYITQFPDFEELVNMKYWKPAEYPTSNLNIDLPLFNVQKYISEAKAAMDSNSSSSEDDMSSSAFSIDKFRELLNPMNKKENAKSDTTPLKTASSKDPEDEFFLQLLERRRANNPKGMDFHLYKLTISDYHGLPKTELILKRAAVLRMNPIPQKHGEPFNVYFLSDENAMEFSTFVCANGGKAAKVVL